MQDCHCEHLTDVGVKQNCNLASVITGLSICSYRPVLGSFVTNIECSFQPKATRDSQVWQRTPYRILQGTRIQSPHSICPAVARQANTANPTHRQHCQINCQTFHSKQAELGKVCFVILQSQGSSVKDSSHALWNAYLIMVAHWWTERAHKSLVALRNNLKIITVQTGFTIASTIQ